MISGATVSLSAGENWTLDSSRSSDTPNDEAGLLHTWYVNGNTLATGKMTLQSSDFSQPGLYDVRLVVEDDDGETSELSFQVQINGDAESSAISSKTLILSGAGFIFLIFTIGVFAYTSRKRSRQTIVPKWVSNSDFSEKKSS